MKRKQVYRSLLNRRNLATYFGYVRVDGNGCWIWTGPVSWGGYGKHHNRCAHRTAYMWFVGAVPEGQQLDHLCRVRACVNPAHLEAVTAAENNRRSIRKNLLELRTHCKRGHDLSKTLRVYTLKDGSPHRVCRTCRNEQVRQCVARRKARVA